MVREQQLSGRKTYLVHKLGIGLLRLFSFVQVGVETCGELAGAILVQCIAVVV